ncbi:MAG: diacylglycerol kinase family protein [Flavobacteriaceae bacterium]
MKNPNDNFVKERLRSIIFSLRGIWLLITTESSIKVQVFFAVLITIAGFYFDISTTEWLVQTLAIGLVLVAESLNTGVEKLSDFVHADYHEKIGFIKDVCAGSAGIAAIITLILGCIIYIPKVALLF